jgi:hypothetical protein
MTDGEVEKIIRSNMNLQMNLAGIRSDFEEKLQRKPLTDEEIEKMRHLIDWTAHWSYNTFARAIEAAHGIKGEA